MHRSETVDLRTCAACGAEFFLGVDRGFALTADDALCFACAVARGAMYDEVHDRWVVGPDASDVAIDAG